MQLVCIPLLAITLLYVTRHIWLHACRLPSAKPFVLAQRYVSNPLLINGCKFGIRLWLLVTGVDPFTCYLHKQGLVLFSTERCGLWLYLCGSSCCCVVPSSERTSV
jgi:hypothetical protein